MVNYLLAAEWRAAVRGDEARANQHLWNAAELFGGGTTIYPGRDHARVLTAGA